MNTSTKNTILIKVLAIALALMCAILLLFFGVAKSFNLQELFMDSDSFKEQLEIMNLVSDAVKESHGFMSTEYVGEDGCACTETFVLGKFEPKIIDDSTGIGTSGLVFNGYVFFLAKNGELKNNLYVKEYSDKEILDCFEGAETNQSVIVNSLIEGIDSEGILLSDSVNNMLVRIEDDSIEGLSYGKDLSICSDISFRSKWSLFGRNNTKSSIDRIMNRVTSIRVPYLDGYFYTPSVCVGNIDTSDNVVTWKEYYSEFDSFE